MKNVIAMLHKIFCRFGMGKKQMELICLEELRCMNEEIRKNCRRPYDISVKCLYNFASSQKHFQDISFVVINNICAGIKSILVRFQIFRFISSENRQAGQAVTRSSLERQVWGSNLGPVKSDTVLLKGSRRCDVSSKEAVLPGRNDAEM